MDRLTVWARGARAATADGFLELEEISTIPPTELEFRPLTPGGRITLEPGDGSPAADTVVRIEGASYGVTVEMKGSLPQARRLRNVAGRDLRGREITIVSAAGRRWMFVSDGTMRRETMLAFPAGAHRISSLAEPPSPGCFATGTMILTPLGERPVETLQPGDGVTTAEGRTVPLLWRMASRFTSGELQDLPALRPVRIAAGALGGGLPNRDLVVSARHRMVIASPRDDLLFLFGAPRLLVAAEHLRAPGIAREAGQGGIEYHHLLFERHEIIFANGAQSESLQPSIRNLGALPARARASYRTAVAGELRRRLRARADALRALEGWEALALGDLRELGAAREAA